VCFKGGVLLLKNNLVLALCWGPIDIVYSFDYGDKHYYYGGDDGGILKTFDYEPSG